MIESLLCCHFHILVGIFHYRTWLLYIPMMGFLKCPRSAWASKLDAHPLIFQFELSYTYSSSESVAWQSLLLALTSIDGQGSPGLGGIRTAGLYTLARLLDHEDTRLKTSSRVRMGLSFAWKTSLAIRILHFLPCNRLHLNPSPLRCLYKPESLVLRDRIIIIIG